VYFFAFLAILVAFNIDLSSLVVGLGVGGIAIALALQNVLGDAFSAFSIYFDRPFEIGDFSFNFEVVYYLKTNDYGKYMDTQQAINFAILETFEKEEIEMPFPTQTIFLNKKEN